MTVISFSFSQLGDDLSKHENCIMGDDVKYNAQVLRKASVLDILMI